MSAREVVEWSVFEQSFGPLTIHERVDHAGAVGAWVTASVNSDKRLRLEDFIPRWEPKRRGDLFEFLSAQAKLNDARGKG
jgi:hypothetical protein